MDNNCPDQLISMFEAALAGCYSGTVTEIQKKVAFSIGYTI